MKDATGQADRLTKPKALRARIEGGQPLSGAVRVSGAKNSATRLLAAACLADETVTLTNAPLELVDLNHKIRFLRDAGVAVAVRSEEAALAIDASGLGLSPYDGGDDFPIRTTYLLVAGQIRKAGRARIPYPGGCRIGARGYDLHVMVWRALGCAVTEHPGFIEVVGDGFRGGRVAFPISTVGGTENALLCAALARGHSEIINAYITPEIDDLIDLLRRMGAQIEVLGNSLVRVEGVARLSGARKDVMPDRIEALTWIVLALMARADLRIDDVPFAEMEIPFIHLEKAGIDLFRNSRSVYVHPECLVGRAIQPFELACGAHPGVISDMQPFFVLLGLAAEGVSRIFDYRYPERIAYAAELARACPEGAVDAAPGRIATQGPVRFRGAAMTSTDLRGSMALVMAAICADGVSTIDDVHMALRGYDRLRAKLRALGVEMDIDER